MVGWGGGSGSSSSEAGGLVRTLKKSFNLCQKLSPRILICAQFLRTCPCIAPLRPAAYTVLAWLLGVRSGAPTPPPPPLPTYRILASCDQDNILRRMPKWKLFLNSSCIEGSLEGLSQAGTLFAWQDVWAAPQGFVLLLHLVCMSVQMYYSRCRGIVGYWDAIAIDISSALFAMLSCRESNTLRRPQTEKQSNPSQLHRNSS